MATLKETITELYRAIGQHADLAHLIDLLQKRIIHHVRLHDPSLRIFQVDGTWYEIIAERVIELTDDKPRTLDPDVDLEKFAKQKAEERTI